MKIFSTAGLIALAISAIPLAAPSPAHADAVAYLVNVTVRPGYNFPNAEAAIGYGNSICDRVASQVPFAELTRRVKADFATDDDFQATYLISQATNELCPAQIWQLRRSAAA